MILMVFTDFACVIELTSVGLDLFLKLIIDFLQNQVGLLRCSEFILACLQHFKGEVELLVILAYRRRLVK